MNNNTSPFEKNNSVDINSTIPATPNTGVDINSTMPANQNTGFDPNFSGNFDRPAAFYPTQPTVQTPAFVQAPVVKQEKSLMEWLISVLVCACGIGGIALGIASIAAADNLYGVIGTTDKYSQASTTLSYLGIDSGPSPTVAVIMAVIALCLGIGAAVLGILFGSKACSKGKPRSTALTIGTACGIAAIIVCIFALFITGCTANSYCSVQNGLDKVDNLTNSTQPYNYLR